MDGNRHHPYDVNPHSNGESSSTELISLEQLQRLVRLLDRTDVSEIELKHLEGGTRLLLRKGKELKGDSCSQQTLLTSPPASQHKEEKPIVDMTHPIVASLVGIFHTWAKPKGGALVAVGDRVKIGQLVGTIQSLNVMNEIESPVAGRVVEILVQEGQAVEYGQHLMTIDSAEGA